MTNLAQKHVSPARTAAPVWSPPGELGGYALPYAFEYLVVPGWHGSGEEHWQTHWEALCPQLQRVEQEDWENPDFRKWGDRLTHAINRCENYVVLVGHSLGAALIAGLAHEWCSHKIAGAFLVAPADWRAPLIQSADCIRGFKDVLPRALPFPSWLVASSNDDYLTLPRAAMLADKWGSRLINVGARDHIGTAARLGLWNEGLSLFEHFLNVIQGGLDH